MKGGKAWQIAVIVIGLLVGAASIGYVVFGGDKPKLRHQTYMIDVITGETFEWKTKGGIMPPMKNPVTDTLTLLPASKDDSGVWTVSTTFRPQISDIVRAFPGVEPAVDPRSGQLRPTDG